MHSDHLQTISASVTTTRCHSRGRLDRVDSMSDVQGVGTLSNEVQYIMANDHMGNPSPRTE